MRKLEDMRVRWCRILTVIEINNCEISVTDCYWHTLISSRNSKLHKVTKLQRFIRRRLFLRKYNNLFFQILYIPENMPTTLGLLFPNGGYLYREMMQDSYNFDIS